ncbi:MAG: DUF1351 domain-containing protein [Eubacteriales bacterium]|nr:DUF1351 domain-containing protein [Eubacteriales bacterium]
MELKVATYTTPSSILFNYEELKQELTEKVKTYETMVYTEDQIKLAKADRAQLNKLKKALNDERIRREKAYMQPFADFKVKINEIIGIIDKPVAVIDKQVKAYEEKERADKRAAVEQLFEQMKADGKVPDFVSLGKIGKGSYLNKSASMSAIEKDIELQLAQIKRDADMLAQLPEFGFEAMEIYKQSLDVNKAVSEAQRMAQIAKAKAEAELAKHMNPPEEVMQELPLPADSAKNATVAEDSSVTKVTEVTEQEQEVQRAWVAFEAHLTSLDALLLKDFFNGRNIEFRPVQK